LSAVDKPRLTSSATRYRPSIGGVLASGLGLLIVVAVGATLWLSISVARDNLVRLMLGSAEFVLQSMVEQVKQNLSGAEHQATFLAHLISSGEIDPENDNRMMDVLLGSLAAAPEIVAIGYISTDFRIFAVGRDGDSFKRVDDNWEGDTRVAKWIAEAERQAVPVWLGESRIGSQGFLALIRVNPVFKEGNFLGATVSAVSVQALSDFLARIDQQTDINHFILAGKERVVAHRDLLAEDLAFDLEGDALERSVGFPNILTIGDPVLEHIWDPKTEELPDLIGEDNLTAYLVEGDEEQALFIYDEISGFGPEI
jgi:adenylate cyclase